MPCSGRFCGGQHEGKGIPAGLEIAHRSDAGLESGLVASRDGQFHSGFQTVSGLL